MPINLTRAAFLGAYREALVARHQWAADDTLLDVHTREADATLSGLSVAWVPCWASASCAYRALGGKALNGSTADKLRLLRAIPLRGNAPAPELSPLAARLALLDTNRDAIAYLNRLAPKSPIAGQVAERLKCAVLAFEASI